MMSKTLLGVFFGKQSSGSGFALYLNMLLYMYMERCAVIDDFRQGGGYYKLPATYSCEQFWAPGRVKNRVKY